MSQFKKGCFGDNLYRTPDWEDFVYLAVTEIRHFGGTSIQVARRLRAMLENLIAVLPPERTVLLRGDPRGEGETREVKPFDFEPRGPLV